MTEVTLIFPHQLFDPHPALSKDRPAVLVEDGLTFGDPTIGLEFHRQKLTLHRAAMRTYAAMLGKRGFNVIYIDFQQGATIADHLLALVEKGAHVFHYAEPTDFLLEKRLQSFVQKNSLKVRVHDTPMFLSPNEWLDEQFGGTKKPFMARFYENQRRRMGILLDAEGNPEGGRWSFDDENRKAMPKKGLDVPPDPTTPPGKAIAEAIGYVSKHFPLAYGDSSSFAYPVSHAEADGWLEKFLHHRFAMFGPYEDAISGRERILFHSVLTPMLNIGLLTPQQVVDRALAFAKEHPVPINSLEGFVRQIVGWREFIRAMYEKTGVQSRTSNFWQFEDRPIPQAFYEGTTGIVPIDVTIQRVLAHGYCHHIERLMILGNFMLLCGFHPKRVYNWFMELFVDAYDWVMVPNVYGMSQFADGGRFTTKPYISGSNYVLKMSDYGKGDWTAIWDGLFWSFIKQHETFFSSQHRLAMMARQLGKMDSARLRVHLDNAETFLATL